MTRSEDREPSQRGRMGAAKRVLFGAVVGLGLGATLAAWVWFDSAADLREANADYERSLLAEAEARSHLHSELTSARDQLEAAAAREDIQRARILLARAMTEIDRANFGQTHDLVLEAVGLLRDSDASAADIDAGALTDVTADVAQISIRVSTDVGLQRAALIAQADRLDRLLAPQ